MVKNIEELCDIIFSIEEKYDLNHMIIQDTYFWQLIRIYIYYEIARKIEIFGSPQQQKVTLFNKIFSFIPFIKNSLFSNPLKGKNHKDILIFDHPRKVKEDGEFKDIYTSFLIEELNKKNNNEKHNLKESDEKYNGKKHDLKKSNDKKHSFEVIESPYLNKHYTKKENYINYNDRILLGSYIYKKRNKINFTNFEKEKIANIQKEIKNSFNIEINLFDIIENHILNFKYEYKKYDDLFKKRTPKYVFVVVAYENQAMISAAKDNGIEVLELQHGVISNYHLGYNYPNEIRKIQYFPDKILSFGEYWKNAANYPIENKDIIPIGYPYLEKNIKYHLQNKKEKNQIIFISQGVIGKYLSKTAYEIAKYLENLEDSYSIIYKLHPGEYSTWEENYKYLKKAQKLDNFQIIDNNEVSLYELFSKSEYQIGVFSTAIYEGLKFNCKTFVMDLPGVEYLNDLIEKNFLKKIKDSDDFISSLNDLKLNSYDSDFFFKKYEKTFLNKIIKK